MAQNKERLDKVLMDRGLCESRSQAQALIMDGKVKVDDETVTKPGTLILAGTARIELTEGQRYVSRGGLKLEKALAVFNIHPQGRAAIDVGAATGGFTDCLLQHGATHVIALDVGYGQLDWKLRNDPRVTVLEKTNIREVQAGQLPVVPSLGVVDTSFISLKKVLPPLAALLSDEADIVALLKPQFEYRDYVKDKGFKGVVRGEENHRRIITGVIADLAELLPDWQLAGLDFSPVTGPKGNIEYLLHYVRRADTPAKQPEMEEIEALSTRIVAKSYEKSAFP